jgi:D-mannonate dehydratase
MVRMLDVYSRAGFTGPIRPDHAAALAGEAQNGRASGYTMGGKVLAFAAPSVRKRARRGGLHKIFSPSL